MHSIFFHRCPQPSNAAEHLRDIRKSLCPLLAQKAASVTTEQALGGPMQQQVPVFEAEAFWKEAGSVNRLTWLLKDWIHILPSQPGPAGELNSVNPLSFLLPKFEQW